MATWGIIQVTQGEIEDEDKQNMKRLDDEFDWELDNFVSLYVTDEKMKQAYKRLDAYANTKFAQEIIKECGYYQFSRTLN